jgi:dolichol-phosphate mannosyltransferase
VRALGAHGVRVLVIDDNSPDGTGEIADRLASELAYVDVLHRPLKEGLGPAYLAGFRHALANGAELVLEMDCDFSHDPADVPRLIAAAADADLVGVQIRDLTAGFKCYRRAVLERIELDTISARGYAFQIETAYRTLQSGFRVEEIPITFVDREEGGSKMSKAIVLEAVWRVPLMRIRGW